MPHPFIRPYVTAGGQYGGVPLYLNQVWADTVLTAQPQQHQPQQHQHYCKMSGYQVCPPCHALLFAMNSKALGCLAVCVCLSMFLSSNSMRAQLC